MINQKAALFFFILFAHSFLSSNLFSPCLAYGSHKLACLCDVGRHCVEGRERKGVNVYSTYPWHPATTLLLLKEGRWWWKVSVSIGRLVELLFKQQKERNRKRKKEKQQLFSAVVLLKPKCRKLNVVFEYYSKCGNHICHSVD